MSESDREISITDLDGFLHFPQFLLDCFQSGERFQRSFLVLIQLFWGGRSIG
jgi:hypothetical protein